MILCDANVLIYAFRRDADRHEEYRIWLERALAEEPAFGYSELVLSSVVRITTHPKIFVKPSTLDEALAFTEAIRDQPNSVPMTPGFGHWDIFCRLARESMARGNLVADAYLAALAVENRAEWITTDRDFSRFTGLSWRHPLV